MTISNWLTLHSLVTALAILSYVIHSHVMHQRRQPTAAIAWMLFILLVPYLALPAYVVFGTRKRPRPRATSATRLQPGPPARWAVDTLLALDQPEPADYADLAVHADGQSALDSLMSMLSGAQHTNDLCTFILARDPLGEAVLAMLCERARAGVRVRLLLDGMGSLMSSPPPLQQLLDAGGAYTIFASPLRSTMKGRTNLRDHRKLVLVDGDLDTGRLWCGGRNLAAEYFNGAPGAPPWRDLSFDLRGPLIRQAGQLFERDWRFARGQPAPDEQPPGTSARGGGEGAQLVASGPDQADDTVYSLLVAAAYRAHQRIVLVTPYFVPDTALLMALCLAARRGVRVELLLPARSNHRLSDMARGRALRSLAQAGAHIWLAPGMLHAKLAVFDDALALAGSANLDSRSLFLNYEMMLAFHRSGDVQRFEAWFDTERTAAAPFQPDAPGLLRDMAEGLILWAAFQL
jgi:cardiolipin synthase A/B